MIAKSFAHALAQVVFLTLAWPASTENRTSIASIDFRIETDNPEVLHFANAVLLLIAEVTDQGTMAQKELPDSILFLSFEDAIVDYRVNPDVIPFFNQTQKDFVTGVDTHSSVCFIQPYDFNHEHLMFLIAHDATANGEKAAEKCFLVGLFAAFDLSGEGQYDDLKEFSGAETLSRLFALLGEV